MQFQNFIFLLLLSWIHHFSPHVQSSFVFCQNDRNYTSESPYQLNLNHTFTALVANASLYDYFTTSIGRSPDLVYGLFQCRGYSPMDACHACANNLATEIGQSCPNQKQGSIYTDKCSLQYSDWNFFSTMDSTTRFHKANFINTTDLVLLRNNLEKLLKSLSPSAATNPSRIASGMTAYTKTRNIYAMVQCSKGISGSDCLTCLDIITGNYMVYLNKSEQEGGLLVAPSCNLQYETHRFFEISPLSQPGSNLPPSFVPSDSVLDGTNHSTSHGKSSKTMVMLVMAAAFAFILITGIFSSLFWRNRARNRVVEDSNRTSEFFLIEFEKLKKATNNFSDENKLGQGGFGPVYKGKMLDGQEIAVKRLSTSSKQGLEELQTEVMLVTKLMHQNLVRLLGFCIEEEEKLLVYEYLPNGSLDKFLFDEKRRLKLRWEMRHNIIVGIARGLLYLHEEYPLKIIHRDMKASNILLDESMTPKISDFGLARLFPGTQNHCFTNRIIGTYGYMAPEYAVRGRYSTKSDVYSFGILVLEIITGRKNSSFQDFRNLQSYAWKHWTNGSPRTIVDRTLGEEFKQDEVLKCINIGLLCVQEAPDKRPTVSDIILKLGSYTKQYPTPLQINLSNSKNRTVSASLKEDSHVIESSHDNTDQPFTIL